MRLGNLCEIVRGSSPRPKEDSRFYGGSVPRLMVADVTRDGKYVTPRIDSLTKEGAALSRPMQKGDLVIAVSGNPGLPAILETDACIHDGFVGLRNLDKTRISVDYLYCYLIFFKEQINNKAVGAIFKNLTTHQIADIEIPLPPLEEQRRIAAILDKADAVRRKRKEAIALTEELLRSAFLEMFGDLSAKDWQMTTVEHIAASHKGSFRTGPFGSQLLHSEFVDEGIAVLGIDNAVQNQFSWGKPRFITEEKYKQLKRYTVHPGDVIITIMGTCGRCAIVPGDCPTAINTKHLCCISLDQTKCIPEFLHSYFLLHPQARQYLQKNAKGAIMDGLNMAIIKGLPVPAPPLDLQKKYKTLSSKIQNLKKQHTDSSNSQTELFNSLLQRAFRGEL